MVFFLNPHAQELALEIIAKVVEQLPPQVRPLVIEAVNFVIGTENDGGLEKLAFEAIKAAIPLLPEEIQGLAIDILEFAIEEFGFGEKDSMLRAVRDTVPSVPLIRREEVVEVLMTARPLSILVGVFALEKKKTI